MDKDKEIKNRIIQTYAEDMAKVIEEDQTGLVKKVIHGEEEHEQEQKNLSPQSKKNQVFMFLGLLFILVGLTTLYYFFLGREVPTVPVEEQFVPLIFNDSSTSIEVSGFTKDEIAQAVYNAVNGTLVKKGGVEGIYLILNKRDIGLREFVTLIKGNFVPGGNKLFVQDNFLMGVVNAEAKDFFILLKVRSTADIFGSLRNWEGKMFFDLQKFFGVNVSTETKYLLTKNFEDGIIQNKNARILYDQEGKIVMMYIFADDNSVVITDNENATREIMLRLASSRVKK